MYEQNTDRIFVTLRNPHRKSNQKKHTHTHLEEQTG